MSCQMNDDFILSDFVLSDRFCVCYALVRKQNALVNKLLLMASPPPIRVG